VLFIPVTDYAAVVEGLASNKLDLAWLGGFTYVQARLRTSGGAVPIVQRAEDAKFTSRFIVPTASTAQTLADLKGKTFAFVDPGSTSGFMVPSAAFIKAGITPEKDFKQVMYSGGHDSTIVAVGSGKVDAGCVADRIYERGCAKGLADCSKLKVVWESPAIPNDPLLYRKALSEDMKKKIREAFASVKNLAFGEMGTVARFDPITDKDYDPLREIAKTLNLDLTKVK